MTATDAKISLKQPDTKIKYATEKLVPIQENVGPLHQLNTQKGKRANISLSNNMGVQQYNSDPSLQSSVKNQENGGFECKYIPLNEAYYTPEKYQQAITCEQPPETLK
jgi:hypothetical protein